MNGLLFNKDVAVSLNIYKITFSDGTYVYTRAKCKFDAEENVRWRNGNVDMYDLIVSVEEINTY